MSSSWNFPVRASPLSYHLWGGILLWGSKMNHWSTMYILHDKLLLHKSIHKLCRMLSKLLHKWHDLKVKSLKSNAFSMKFWKLDSWFSSEVSKLTSVFYHTANMCSEITVEVHWKNCNFSKLQFFTVDLSSLHFLQLKNCNFSIILLAVYSALNWMLILQVFTVFKNTTKKL